MHSFRASIPAFGAFSWADRITLGRIFTAPVLLITAVMHAPQFFLLAAIAGALSDASDGTVARLLNSATPRGALFDSYADALFYSAALIGLIVLFPTTFVNEWPITATVVLAYALPIVVGYRKFGRITSYHTWLARLSLLVLGPGVVCWLWFDRRMLMVVGTVVLLVSALEELAITGVLQHSRDNVPHVFRVLTTTHLQRRKPR